MSNPGLTVTTPSDTTIVVTRHFDAPRELVWEAMTDPSRLRRWMFAPPGWAMSVCEGEPRVGGSYRWAWTDESGATAMTIHGVFREVLPPERIVHTEVMEMSSCGPLGELLAELVLAESGAGTDMRMTLTYDSKAARDGALASGMDQGMEAGYRQLDEQLGLAV